MLFPAWAGVILGRWLDGKDRITVPRMGGGDPAVSSQNMDLLDCSPHGRG